MAKHLDTKLQPGLKDISLAAVFEGFQFDNQWTGREIAEIERRHSLVPVFVYGAQKEGFSEHHRLKNFQKVGQGYTQQQTYRMYTSHEGDCVAFYMAADKNSGRLYGELYQVPPEVLFDLDADFERGVYYSRLFTHIRWSPPKSKQKRPYISGAFMWTGRFDNWKTLHTNGQLIPNKLIRPKKIQTIAPFYVFTPADDEPGRSRQAANIAKIKELQQQRQQAVDIQKARSETGLNDDIPFNM